MPQQLLEDFDVCYLPLSDKENATHRYGKATAYKYGTVTARQ